MRQWKASACLIGTWRQLVLGVAGVKITSIGFLGSKFTDGLIGVLFDLSW